MIHKNNNKFECSVYRKGSFTGLGMRYFSNWTFKFKLNCILTLLSRAYRICSNFNYLHMEFTFLKKYFRLNGYCSAFVERQIWKFLGDKFDPITDVSADSSDDKPLYLSFPYFGPIAEKLKTELLLLQDKYYRGKKFQDILANGFTIGSFFNYKDKLPLRMQSSLVNKYSCVHCTSEYVGMSTRTLGVRADEHANVSFRTGSLLLDLHTLLWGST